MTAPRICLLQNALDMGGVERQLLALALALTQDGIDVELVPFKNVGPLFDARAEAKSQIKTWSPESSGGLDWQAMRRLAAHWDTSGTNVVLAANQYATIVAAMTRRLCKRPPRLVSAFHSSPDHLGPGLKSALMYRLYKWTLKQAARIVYVSGLQQQAWERLGLHAAGGAEVIFNGVDLARFGTNSASDRQPLGWGKTDFVIGLCAGMRTEKRITDLVEAVGLLVSRGVPAKLLLIGDGSERATIEARIAKHLPPGTAHITGYMNDVTPWLHTCDALALVSSAEAFSIAVLEGMACGKPMVLSRVGGAEEQIEDGVHGYIVTPGDVPAIADRLERLWRDGTATAMGARAKERVTAEFSQDAMVARYKSLFLRIAA